MRTDELLRLMREGDCPGAVYVNHKWLWTINGEYCTRAVKTLIKRGEAAPVYHFNKRASLALIFDEQKLEEKL